MGNDDLTRTRSENPFGLTPSDAQSLVFHEAQIVSDRYKIVRFIARGGMGQVWEAVDCELGITIALKTLNPELVANEASLRRFKEEIHLARQIAHPNVCRTFDLGRHVSPQFGGILFLTMERLRGPTLSERIKEGGAIPSSEAFDLVRQMCEGLAGAHQLGIVHRDFKSSNVILELAQGGAACVKITDFGLARRILDAQFSAAGTPAYMAPEQFLGKSSAASDIYSLGVVIYEMVYGCLPVTEHANKDAGVRTGPQDGSRQIDRRWDLVITKCLDPVPGNRFQSASEVIVALEGYGRPGRPYLPFGFSRRHALATSALSIAAVSIAGLYEAREHFRRRRSESINSIAVIPLTNRMKRADRDYMTDGMTEALISALSHLPRLKLMSRSAVMRLKAASADPIHAGRQLGVSAILTGYIYTSSTPIDVSLELVDVASGIRLWGNRFVVAESELSHIPGEVATEVARALNRDIAGEHATHPSEQISVNPSAYRSYLRGRYEWNKRTLDGYRKAVQFYKTALDEDPTFALAYAGLADGYSFQSGFSPPDEVFPRARQAAQQALQLNERLAEAHTSLGFVLMQFDWSWDAADREFKRALELNFNYATAHSMYSRLLSVLGRFAQASKELSLAQSLDPLSIGIALNAGFLAYLSRDYDRAIREFKQTLDLEPGYSDAQSYLAYVFTARGDLAEALRIYEKMLQTQSGDPGLVADAARCYALAGHRATAGRLSRKLKELASKSYVPPSLQAEVCAAMHEPDESLAYLEKAIREKAWPIIYLKVEPIWDPLRADKRFQSLLGRLGLER